MQGLVIDKNSRSVQIFPLGFCKNFEAGVVDDPEITGIVRIKNIGDGDAIIRYDEQPSSEGMYISAGETVFLYLEEGKHLNIMQGTLNIMF